MAAMNRKGMLEMLEGFLPDIRENNKGSDLKKNSLLQQSPVCSRARVHVCGSGSVA